MIGDKRNFSLSIWDHKDNFLCLLKSPNQEINGQSYDEQIVKNINGEQTLSFDIPAYIFDTESQTFIKNEKWDYIFNEQKIRYTKYDDDNNNPIQIKEFVLKNHIENRNGYEKTINCQCEFLAVYELAKTGWNINFDIDYVSKYESEQNDSDLITLDYWLRKIFYKETHLGRVSTTTECTYLLQGMQLRDEEGYPISTDYTIDEKGNYKYLYIDEPICDSTTTLQEYYNPTGWHWEVQSVYKNDPAQTSLTTVLYEEPTITVYNEVYPNQYKAFSYQKVIGEPDSTKELKVHPIKEQNYGTLQYVTDIKKHLIKVERSNIFSIIQTLCEAFEVWAYFEYNYDEKGHIIDRKILFKSEAVNDDIKFDFSYGKNLLSCSKTIDSNELITKLTVLDTNSSLDSDRILSIKQASGNPTGESYLYNFEYFYNLGALTKGEDNEDSDEFKINLHNGTLKSCNNAITRVQNTLVPLYDRKSTLEADLEVQQASYTAIIENIKSIQDKIDAIPANEREISCWSEDINQYNYIGELKTVSTTTVNGETKYYIDFGREDILYDKNINVIACQYDVNNNLIEGEQISISSYIPRYYTHETWIVGTSTSDESFTLLDSSIGKPDYGNDESLNYIKGFYLNSPIRSYIRVKYKYAPLAYYYTLMRQYYNKLKELYNDIENLKSNIKDITNKILVYELNLSNLLSSKNKLILEFEKKYKNFIREGYWEPSDYQSQLNSKTLDTDNPSSKFEGMITVTTKLSDLNLNDSLHNYSYYINLNVSANEIDIDSISMTTANPNQLTINTQLPRYRGNDYEVFLSNDNNVIIGISPNLIDSYNTHEYDINYYKSTVSYSTNGENVSNEYNWIYFSGKDSSPSIQEKYIYLTNDNLLIESLKVYGDSIDNDNELEENTDYTYLFDYAGYDDEGHRVPLDEQSSYSNDIHYDYIIKITLKNTNKVNSYSKYIVTYNEENTLQFLYNDAVKTSNKYAVPQITYSVSVLDLSSLEEYKDYDPTLGQKVPIYDVEMGLNGYEGIITSISKVLEKPEETNIEIATYQTRFEDIFQKLTSTMTEVKYNESELLNAANAITEFGTVKEQVFQKSLDTNNYKIQLGTNNDITIDKKSGITLVDEDNYSAVKIIGNGIFLTEDYKGSNSEWKTGITGNGINANALTAGNIDTKNINIWNASEGQVRFIWNEQGLFAFGADGVTGTSASTVQDFIDYNKYIKFNQEGLRFNDGKRSALSLGWDGLKMDTLEGALRLDANEGLILRKNGLEDSVTRLKLGKISSSTSDNYGLRLFDSSGSTSFQSDSDGNLWLSKYINIGGTFNEIQEIPVEATAGIVGENSVPYKYQMGIMRDFNGDVYWNINPIRFWAGPQTYAQYLENVQITSEEVASATTITSQILNSITTNDPTLARFKVDADGNIVASGIDVGGWIGAGKLLRSKNNEAILRSDGYTNSTPNYPVIAVGKSTTTIDGRDYNFRVYQDGSVNINKGNIHIGNFDVDDLGNLSVSTDTFKTGDDGTYLYTQGFSTTPDGTSISTNGFQTNSGGTSVSTATFKTDSEGTELSTSTFSTGANGSSLSTNTFKVNNAAADLIKGSVAGWTANKDSLQIVTTNEQYGTYLFATTNPEGHTIISGKKNDPSFFVQNNGRVYARDLIIEGGEINIFGSGFKSNSISTSLGNIDVENGQTIIGSEGDESTEVYLYTGEIAGWKATTTGLEIVSETKINGVSTTFKTGMYSKGEYSATTYQSGPSAAPTFVVKNDGSVLADNIKITGNALSKSTDKIIDANNETFYVTKEGKIKATSGEIAGWNISTSTLEATIKVNNKNYYEGIQKPNTTTDIVFYAGENKSNPKFKVLADGTLYAQGAVISGTVEATVGEIAGFTIGQKALWNSKSTSTDEHSGVYVGNDAIALGADNSFKVDKDGNLEARNVKITGGSYSFTTNVLTFTDAQNQVVFNVTKNGKLSAKSGDIAGWEFNDKRLVSSTTISNKTYNTGIATIQASTTKVFYAGTNNNPEFYVLADGTVKATKLDITTGNLGDAFTNVSNNITSLSSNINSNINSLSSAINLQIVSLSTDINGDLNSLSTTLIGQINSLSTDINIDINSLSTDVNAKINGLSDSRMEIWYYDVNPSSSVEPEKDWLNPDIRNIHIDDLYYNISTGEAFRYTKENNNYKWEAIPEYSVTAQQLANQAKSIADKKRTVFTSTPKGPYDIGDLWIINNNGYEIQYCISATTVENAFSNNDWQLAATDNTLAKQTIKSSRQVWRARKNTTSPNKPAASDTIVSTNVYDQWTYIVPSFSTTYPHYFYTNQYIKGDNTTTYSDVIYDSTFYNLEQKASSELSTYITSNNTIINALTTQVDNQIDVWYKTVNASTSVAPTTSWTTNAIKDLHIGDLYYNIENGLSWRYDKTNNVYSWKEMPESTSTLLSISTAQATADGKRTVFATTNIPYAPYDIGDLWVNTSTMLVKYSNTKRTDSSQHSNDWKDTVGNKNIKSSIQLWYANSSSTAPTKPSSEITSTATTGGGWRKVVPTYTDNNPYYFYCWQYKFADDTFDWSDVIFDRTISGIKDNLASYINTEIGNIQDQIDNQVEVWYYEGTPTASNEPTKNWNTIALKDEHIGDMYYDLTNKKGYKYTKNDNTYSWEQVNIGNAFYTVDARSIADNKRRVFTSEPSSPYDVGDLWVKGNEVRYYNGTGWILTATDDTVANKNIKSSTLIWYATDSSTTPNKPSSKITQTGNVYKQWTIAVPTTNIGYPYYFYTTQYELADGILSCDNVSYDSHSVGGFIADTTGIQLQKVDNYYIGMQSPPNKATNDVVIYAGTKGKGLTTNEFVVTANGNLKAINAEIVGNITANTGYIGTTTGFSIDNKKIYNGKSTLAGTANGVYIGTDGISVGSSSKYFKANANGTIEANGLTIKNGSISIGNFAVDSNSTSISTSQFKLTPDTVSLSTPSFITNNSSSEFKTGTISGWTATGDTLQIIDSTNTYGTLLKANPNSTGIAIAAGVTTSPAFKVYNNGKVEASNLHITGGSISIGRFNTNSTSGSLGDLIYDSTSTSLGGLKTDSTSTSIGTLNFDGINTILSGANTTIGTGNNKIELNANGVSNYTLQSSGTIGKDDNTGKITVNSSGNLTYKNKGIESNSNSYALKEGGTVGGWTATNDGLRIVSNDNKYGVLLHAVSATTDGSDKTKKVIAAGDVVYSNGQYNWNAPQFYVTKGGFLHAESGEIAGWTLSPTEFSSFSTGNNKFYTGIRKPSNSTDVVFYAGTSGTTNIKNNQFYVQANGQIKATGLQISSVNGLATTLNSITTNVNSVSTKINSVSSSLLTLSQTLVSLSTYVDDIDIGGGDPSYVGGFVNTTTGNSGLDNYTGGYYVGMRSPNANNNIVFYAGTSGAADENDQFTVKADGSVKASNLTLTGGSINLSNNFQVTNTGDVYFNGTISAWYDTAWRTGVISDALVLKDYQGNIKNVRVVKGLIVDIS